MKKLRWLALGLAWLLLLSCAACGLQLPADPPADSAPETGLVLLEDAPASETEETAEPEEEEPGESGGAVPDTAPEESPAAEDTVTVQETQVTEDTSAENDPEPSTSDTSSGEEPAAEEAPAPEEEPAVREDGIYDSRDEVALYIHLYGHLPDNYITKSQAQALGWSGGSLEPYAPGKCIGGGYFGNYEGLLPAKKGRSYTECDIDTLGARGRGAKRIVFSNDGLIYYTEDHYESFTLLYGEDAL